MIHILIGALILSIWCVNLFFGKNIGASMFLFIYPFTYFVIDLLRRKQKIENKRAKILVIPILLLASSYAIFNNDFFNTVNIFVIPILLALMILGLFNEKFNLNFDLVEKIMEIIFIPFSLIGETFEKVKQAMEDKFKINRESKKAYKTKKIVKGICITIPVVLIIVVLLASADEIFGSMFTKLLVHFLQLISKVKISNIVLRILLMIGAFVYFLCFFDFICTRYEKDDKEIANHEKTKDNFTIKMILGMLNIVYLVFCIIQIKSLFMQELAIDYAQYARQGFFQLMIVSIINLITILIAKKSENKNQYITIMSLLMIIFTFIILISSAVRMYFYETAYGYTLLRLLVYCVLLTESILLIPTILYVINQKINLPKVYFSIIIVIYMGMNFANFDAIISKRNIERYIETGKIDIEYLKYHTKTDAIKQIIRILEIDSSNDEVKTEVETYLKNTYNLLEKEKVDFRDFNLSKFLAKYRIQNKQKELDN